MADFFDFSFPVLEGLDGIFSGLGEEMPNIAEEVVKLALNQSFGRTSSHSTVQQLLRGFASGAFSGQSAIPKNASYFQLSQGQNMAQLAAAILRAQRRNL